MKTFRTMNIFYLSMKFTRAPGRSPCHPCPIRDVASSSKTVAHRRHVERPLFSFSTVNLS